MEYFRGNRLLAECNSGCGCVGAPYAPICGADGIVYYSPCHAACTTATSSGTAQLYHHCACISFNGTLPTYTEPGMFVAYNKMI